MTIYQEDHSPFFYIIQDTVNGMYYAGCRWAINASPSTFMTASGYKTSSKIINDIIDEHGLTRFVIRKIKLFENETDVRTYETKFLLKVDAKNNANFYNLSNGIGMPPDLEIIIKKLKETNLERYGHHSSFGCQKTREKIKKTNLERYGNISPLSNAEIKEKIKETMIDRYGTENPSHSSIIREKYVDTMIKRYGVDCPSKCPEIAAKISESNKKYYEQNAHHRKGKPLTDETKEKLRQANLGKTLSEELKKHMSEMRKNKVWIKKEGKCKHINRDEFEHYISLGWECGRILRPRKRKKAPITEEQRQNLKNKLSRKRWIKKDNEPSKFVDESELDYYLSIGWKPGRNR